MKIGAQQFWITAPDADDPSAALRAAVPPEVGSVTQLSHSRTILFVEGSECWRLLSKGVALDLHPDEFCVDVFAVTGLHHIPVLLHRSGKYRYEVYAMRTFALALWEWLTDAALPFGYDIGIEHKASG
jgi:sarcosine oxidase subunit gamma